MLPRGKGPRARNGCIIEALGVSAMKPVRRLTARSGRVASRFHIWGSLVLLVVAYAAFLGRYRDSIRFPISYLPFVGATHMTIQNILILEGTCLAITLAWWNLAVIAFRHSGTVGKVAIVVLSLLAVAIALPAMASAREAT